MYHYRNLGHSKITVRGFFFWRVQVIHTASSNHYLHEIQVGCCLSDTTASMLKPTSSFGSHNAMGCDEAFWKKQHKKHKYCNLNGNWHIFLTIFKIHFFFSAIPFQHRHRISLFHIQKFRVPNYFRSYSRREFLNTKHMKQGNLYEYYISHEISTRIFL